MTTLISRFRTFGLFFRPTGILLQVVLLSLSLGVIEALGLLSFPALMSVAGWDSSLLENLPAGLSRWVTGLSRMRLFALALPMVAFGVVGTAHHLRSILETRLLLRWQERIFRDCLRGMLSGRFPPLARLSEHDAAHILAVQTERAATALFLGLRLVLQGILLAVQAVVAALLFGWLVLPAALLLGGGFILLLHLHRRWLHLGGDWSDASEELFDRILSGLTGWESILTDPAGEAWLEDLHAHLGRYITLSRKFYDSLDRNSALVNAVGTLCCLVLILGAYLLGAGGGVLMMLGVLLYRALPPFKQWLRACQELVQHIGALQAIERWQGRGAPFPKALVLSPFPCRLEGVRFAYEADRPLLQGVDLELPSRGIVGISGPNGCGKTTLLRLIAHLLPAGQGAWRRVCDERSSSIPIGEMPDCRAHIRYLSSQPLVWGESLEVFLEASLGDPSIAPLLQVLWPEATAESLAGLDLSDWGRNLSMGMRQRVALLRALRPGCDLLCLDEPSQHLDATARQGLVTLLKQRSEESAVLLVSQDPELLAACTVRYELTGGRLQNR